ncbi:MAG: MmgE/PrpD family protein [Chloroflexi bacterium]|nr:MmgE/PrpD family protein [Chloroflexota bacterium]
MKSITGVMADFAKNLSFNDIPDMAVWEAKRFLLDSIGCALAAVGSEDMESMQRYVESLGGVPKATVIGSGYCTNMANAGLMNSLLIRALDYNDIYWEQDPSHPSDMIGIALSCGEALGKSGRDILTAILIAYELEMRWCHAAHPGIREIGWHHATLTQFVSPFVAGKLMGLNEEQMVAAAGICGSSHFTLGGVVAGHLTNMKNMADPFAVQAGIHAALMAREGITGSEYVLEGKEGLFEVLKSVEWRPEELTRNLGEEFLITRCGYKAYPTEALTHQPISAAIQICKENHLKAEDIVEIHVETTTRGADILSDPSKYTPETKETADHSLPYVIAAAIADGNVFPDSFSEEKLHDPRIRGLLKKIHVTADPEIDSLFPKIKRARVHITARDGQNFSAQVDDAKGTPNNPMSDREIEEKFRANSRYCFPSERCDAIIDATWNFDEVINIKNFMQLLTK